MSDFFSVSKEHTKELMTKYFPKCPLCESEPNYSISNSIHIVQCNVCKAKFVSEDFKDINKDLTGLALFAFPTGGFDSFLGRARSSVFSWINEVNILKKECPISTWINLETKPGMNKEERMRYKLKQIEEAKPKQIQDEQNQAHILPIEVTKSILLENNESLLTWINNCYYKVRPQSTEAELGYSGFLIITNQRLLFACKMSGAKDYGIPCVINLEDIASVSPGQDSIVILEKTGQDKSFVREQIQSLIPVINTAISERKSVLQTLKEKERIHVVVDFSSLKDIMAKGGIIMSTSNCPKCNAMLDIPESGKILFCKFCGAQIKPVDIFEKIKSLIQ